MYILYVIPLACMRTIPKNRMKLALTSLHCPSESRFHRMHHWRWWVVILHPRVFTGSDICMQNRARYKCARARGRDSTNYIWSFVFEFLAPITEIASSPFCHNSLLIPRKYWGRARAAWQIMSRPSEFEMLAPLRTWKTFATWIIKAERETRATLIGRRATWKYSRPLEHGP